MFYFYTYLTSSQNLFILFHRIKKKKNNNKKNSFCSAFLYPYSLFFYGNFWHKVSNHWVTFKNANFIMSSTCLELFADFSLLLGWSK